MWLERLRHFARHLWSALAAFITALCLMAAGTAQGAGAGVGAAQSSVTPGKVSSEVWRISATNSVT